MDQERECLTGLEGRTSGQSPESMQGPVVACWPIRMQGRGKNMRQGSADPS